MIPIEVTESFTEDELALVLRIVNAGSSLEITPKTLRAYRFKFLVDKLLSSRSQLNESGIPIFVSVLNKLKIPVPEDIHDPPQKAITN